MTTSVQTQGAKASFRWLSAAVVVVCFVYLSLDGYHNAISISFRGSSAFFEEPPVINWMHGWPCAFLVRPSIYSLDVGPGKTGPPAFTGDIGYYSRWPFDNAPASVFHIAPLVVDALVLAALLAGVWVGVGMLASRFRYRPRFGLRSLFALTLLVALVIGFNLHSYLPRHVCQFAALGVMLAAASVSCYAAVASLRNLRLRMVEGAVHRQSST